MLLTMGPGEPFSPAEPPSPWQGARRSSRDLKKKSQLII